MSELRARIDIMRPARPGPTRTAAPQPGFPQAKRYFGYLLFGLGGVVMLLVAFNLLRTAWALMEGEAAFRALMQSFTHPIYRGFHALAFVWLSWVALRFFRLFPATQPFRLGPFRRPPDAVLIAGLAGLFLAATAGITALLAGWL